MSDTIRHALPLLSAGQAQKEITHNEAILAIDRQLHLAVQSRALAMPPAAPVAGAAYIVAAGAADAWAGQAGNIASYDGFGWHFTVPVTGCVAWIVDEAVFTVHAGGWSAGGWPAKGLRVAGREILSAAPATIASPTGGSVVDSECRTALAQLLTALKDQGIVL